ASTGVRDCCPVADELARGRPAPRMFSVPHASSVIELPGVLGLPPGFESKMYPSTPWSARQHTRRQLLALVDLKHPLSGVDAWCACTCTLTREESLILAKNPNRPCSWLMIVSNTHPSG